MGSEMCIRDRFDKVQDGAGGEAGSPSISGVPVNLGVHEYDVYCQCDALQVVAAHVALGAAGARRPAGSGVIAPVALLPARSTIK